MAERIASLEPWRPMASASAMGAGNQNVPASPR